MNIPKTALAKSKSSNSTSEAKKNTQKNEKVSRSNAEFQPRTTLCTGVQPLMLKKRGVYVEKKPTKISINQSGQNPDVPPNQSLISSRPMPRPNKKRFLTSVLNILSKSTAGTQCPDDTERTRKTDKTINKQKIREDEEDIREEWTTAPAPNNSKKKPKYRSKILNNEAYKDSFTVLQSKKDIVPSSSNNSEYINAKYDPSSVDPETIKWAESLPPLYQEYESTASAASHSKKVRLIAKDSKLSMVSEKPKFDNGIYDFFVDMIKTTMNLEGLDTEPANQQVLTSANHSKVTLQSKESLTRKINVEKIEESESQTFKVSRKMSSHHAYSIMPDERDEFTNRQMLEHFQPQLNNYRQHLFPTTNRKRKLKTDSFQYKKANPLPKITSLPLSNKKKIAKQNAKRDFLKILKEELQMKSNETFEEPENFYEALKVIARNKRRTQEWKSEVPSDPDDHICEFKPRRVISKKSTGKQSGYYSQPRPIPKTGMTSYKKRRIIRQYDDASDYSHHSIEVTGYDYEVVKKPVKKPKKIAESVRSVPLPPPNRFNYEAVTKPKIKPAKIVKKSNVSFVSNPPTPPYDDFWTDYYDSDVSPMLLQRQYVFDKLKQLESTGQ